MVNAWSLAASILDGTFDEDYPIMTDKEEHSDAWYDYKRNDPNAENPFTDPVDRARADFVVGGGNTAAEYETDGLDYENNYYDKYMADIDDQRSHHFQTGNVDFNYEPKVAHYYKYHEEEILKDIEEYVSGTYKGHYTGNSHEFRKVQTIDLMASKDLAAAFVRQTS